MIAASFWKRRHVLFAAAGLAASAATRVRAETSLIELEPAAEALSPFQIHVTQAALNDLKRRLAATRWPDAGTATDWSQGAPLARMQALVGYWRDQYDWRALIAARLKTRSRSMPCWTTSAFIG